jgi:hypothetical protein
MGNEMSRNIRFSIDGAGAEFYSVSPDYKSFALELQQTC